MDNMNVVVSKVENVSENVAALYENGIFEYATFAKGDGWSQCK